MVTKSTSAVIVKLLLAGFAVALGTSEYDYEEDNSRNKNQWIDGLSKTALALGNMISSLDNCEYICAGGRTKTPDHAYISKANGCGTKDWPMQALNDYPGITECCNKHDICYDTCNSDKAGCDKVFKQCLDSYCYSTDGGKDCSHFSNLAYGGVALLGCSAYLSAQKESCSCK